MSQLSEYVRLVHDALDYFLRITDFLETVEVVYLAGKLQPGFHVDS